MKQHKHDIWPPQQPLPTWAAAAGKQETRRFMHRGWRRLFILLLALLVIVSVLAGLAAWRPWIVSWNTRVLRQAGSSQVVYQVHLKPDAVPGLTQAPMDAVYLDELVVAVEPAFSTRLEMDLLVDAESRTTLDAVLRAHEAGDRQPILLQISEPVMDPVSQSFPAFAVCQTSHSLRIDLDPYRERAAAIAARLEQPLVFELVLLYRTDFELSLPGGPSVISKTASLVIPLNQPVFRMERSEERAADELQPLHQVLFYRIHLELFPWPIFLAAAVLSLISLLMLLFMTHSRPKDHFRRSLRRMKRLARGRLMMIGDRTWDPAWCVRITDFRNMAKTARKLKHPVFCYVDDLSAWPVAYFYTYYGENNFCHIFTEHPELLENDLAPAASDEDVPQEEEQENHFPVLPEEDELPDGGNSPAIRPARADRPVQPFEKPISPPMNTSANTSANKPMNKPISEAVEKPVEKPVPGPADRSGAGTVDQPREQDQDNSAPKDNE